MLGLDASHIQSDYCSWNGVISVFPPQALTGRGKPKNISTSKNLMHSSDHIKGNQARKGGSNPGTPSLGETLSYRKGDCEVVVIWGYL